MRRAAALKDSWELLRVSCVIVALYPLLADSFVFITILLDLRERQQNGGLGRDVVLQKVLGTCVSFYTTEGAFNSFENIINLKIQNIKNNQFENYLHTPLGNIKKLHDTEFMF